MKKINLLFAICLTMQLSACSQKSATDAAIQMLVEHNLLAKDAKVSLVYRTDRFHKNDFLFELQPGLAAPASVWLQAKPHDAAVLNEDNFAILKYYLNMFHYKISSIQSIRAVHVESIFSTVYLVEFSHAEPMLVMLESGITYGGGDITSL